MRDPAFMLYTANFLTDTRRMTNEQVGKYIKLICYQHQTGHITEDEFFEIVSEKDAPILHLYKVDNEGLYYSEYVDEIKAKRNAYCISRSNNAKKKKPKDEIPKQDI